MIPERVKPFVLPIAALALLEIWARAVQLQSDSVAPPSAVAVGCDTGITMLFPSGNHTGTALSVSSVTFVNTA